MANLMSPEEVWQGIEIDDGELDVTVVKEYESEKAIFREVYFNGKRTKNGVTRIFGVLALPKSEENPPVVLLCHDSSSTIDMTYLNYFVEMDMAVFCADTYGVFEGRKFTFYPDDISYANKSKAGDKEFCADEGARKTMVFEWTLVQRYSLKYLRSLSEIDSNKIACVGIRDGSISAWHLAYIESDLKAVVALFYAGWKEYGVKYKFADDNAIELNSGLVSFVAGISPQSYASICKVPLLYLTASNDELGNLDRAFDTMARINGEVLSGMMITPNTINNLGYLSTRNLRLWLNMFLFDAKIELPIKPMIKIENFDGKLLARAEVEDYENVKRVDLYFSEGTFVPSARAWLTRELTLAGGGFVGSIDIDDSSETLYAFANVEFKNGFTLSSNYIAITPSELGVDVKLVKENIIYNGLMGVDAFSGISGRKATNAYDTFSDKRMVEVQEGAGGIEGITSIKNLATFKLASPKYSGEDGDILVMDICSEVAQNLKAIMFCSLGENEVLYSADIKTVGGPLWQNFKFEVTDFKDSNKVALDSWSRVSLLMFTSNEKFILNNLLWI